MLEELIDEVGVTGEVIGAREARAAARGMRGNSSSPLRRTQSLSSGKRDVIGSFSVEPVSYGKNSLVLGRVPADVTHRASNGFASELQERSENTYEMAVNLIEMYRDHIDEMTTHLCYIYREKRRGRATLEDIVWDKLARRRGYRADDILFKKIHDNYGILDYYNTYGLSVNNNYPSFRDKWKHYIIAKKDSMKQLKSSHL